MESAAIPLDQLGLPLTDLIDFVMDIGANWSNCEDDDEDVRLMGQLGFAALIVSCGVNLTMVLLHYRKHKRLYNTLMDKSATLWWAFVLWMPIACTNIEVVLLYIVFAKIYSGSFELNLGFKTIHHGNELNEKTFLPKAMMNEMEVASIQVKKYALFSQLTENLPELIFQGRAALIMMAADPPRIPGNWQLLSLGSTFTMLFGKMIVNLLLFAVDVGVSKKLMKLFLEEGIPTGQQNADGTQIKNYADNWRIPVIKWGKVRTKTYCLCGFSGFVTLCTIAFFGEVLLFAEFAKEDLLEVIILMLFAAGLVSLVTFFLITRLVVQELDLCWQVNLDVYKATFVLLCSSFASGMLACIHEDLAIAANRHLVGLISVTRSILFMASLATTKIYPTEMRDIIGGPTLAWSFHGWSNQLSEDSSLSSLPVHRIALIAANLFTALLHLNLCLCGCYNSHRTINGDYLKMNDEEKADSRTWGTGAKELADAHDHLEELQEQRIRTLLEKEVSKNEEFDDLVTSTLIILDEGNEVYKKLIAFNTKRQELDATLKRAMEENGSSVLRDVLEKDDSKFGLDMSEYQQEVSERTKAEEDLEGAKSTIGSEALRNLINTLQSLKIKIDFEAARAEWHKRLNAEKKRDEVIGSSLGSAALKEMMQSLSGDGIDFVTAEAELKTRERAEVDLAEVVDKVVGTNALSEKIKELSEARVMIEFTDAKHELEKRSEAEKKMNEGMASSVGSDALKALIDSLASDRINVESAESELKNRQRAEIELQEAVESGVGANTLKEVIDRHAGVRVDLGVANSEIGRRGQAESELTEGIGKTVGSSGLKDMLKQFEGERIDSANPEVTFELKKRERGEEELAEAINGRSGAKALGEVIEQLSTVKIDFELAKAELLKRSTAEKKLMEGIDNTIGSKSLKELMQSLKAERINTEPREVMDELKKRERAEFDLRTAAYLDEFDKSQNCRHSMRLSIDYVSRETKPECVGSAAVTKVIQELSGVKIDFTAAREELSIREDAEKEIAVVLSQSIGAAPLRDVIFSHGLRVEGEESRESLNIEFDWNKFKASMAYRIDYGALQAELKQRKVAEAELQYAVSESVGVISLTEAMEKLSTAKIDFSAAEKERTNRDNVESILKHEIENTTGSAFLRQYLKDIQDNIDRGLWGRADLEVGRVELKARELAEADIAQAMELPGEEPLLEAVACIQRKAKAIPRSDRVDLSKVRDEIRKRREAKLEILDKAYQMLSNNYPYKTGQIHSEVAAACKEVKVDPFCLLFAEHSEKWRPKEQDFQIKAYRRLFREPRLPIVRDAKGWLTEKEETDYVQKRNGFHGIMMKGIDRKYKDVERLHNKVFRCRDTDTKEYLDDEDELNEKLDKLFLSKRGRRGGRRGVKRDVLGENELSILSLQVRSLNHAVTFEGRWRRELIRFQGCTIDSSKITWNHADGVQNGYEYLSDYKIKFTVPQNVGGKTSVCDLKSDGTLDFNDGDRNPWIREDGYEKFIMTFCDDFVFGGDRGHEDLHSMTFSTDVLEDPCGTLDDVAFLINQYVALAAYVVHLLFKAHLCRHSFREMYVIGGTNSWRPSHGKYNTRVVSDACEKTSADWVENDRPAKSVGLRIQLAHIHDKLRTKAWTKATPDQDKMLEEFTKLADDLVQLLAEAHFRKKEIDEALVRIMKDEREYIMKPASETGLVDTTNRYTRSLEEIEQGLRFRLMGAVEQLTKAKQVYWLDYYYKEIGDPDLNAESWKFPLHVVAEKLDRDGLSYPKDKKT